MDYEKLELTREQIQAAKSVYRAIRKAAELNVEFWDDYGTLACYNGNTIECLEMDERGHSDIEIHENNIYYYELLDNFHPGNSDDRVYAKPRNIVTFD